MNLLQITNRQKHKITIDYYVLDKLKTIAEAKTNKLI